MGELSRRSFLKGFGAVGAVTVGSFVIKDPKIVSGNLLVPNPEPTIVQVTSTPEMVGDVVEAYITRADLTTEIMGTMRARIEMEVINPLDSNLSLLWQVGKVRIYPAERRGQ